MHLPASSPAGAGHDAEAIRCEPPGTSQHYTGPMKFGAPVLLWSLLSIPALAALYVAAQRRRMRYAVSFTNLQVLEGVQRPARAWRRHVPMALFLLALVPLLVGLARPQGSVLVPREQATLVLSMDVSGSMRATDVAPSRLEAAQAAALTFVDGLPDKFPVGLVTFSEDAEVLAQPSRDRRVVRESIASLTASGPTAMGDSIVQALRLTAARTANSDRRDDSGARNRRPDREHLNAVLLLSDGASTSGDTQPMEAAERARALGVPVFTIALGTPEGVVEIPDDFGQRRLVRVPPDYDTLRSIARVTHGEYFYAPNEDELRRIYDEIGSRIGFEREQEELTVAFAAAALVLAAAAGATAFAWGNRFP